MGLAADFARRGLQRVVQRLSPNEATARIRGPPPGCQSKQLAGHSFPSFSHWVVLSHMGLIPTPPSAISSLPRSKGGRPQKENRIPSAAVQAHLATFKFDVPKLLQRHPPIASYDVERVQRITSNLAGLGVDVKRVVEVLPSLLGGKVEAYDAVVQLLRNSAVDPIRAVNGYPGILRRRVPTLQHIMDTVASCGFCVADVMNLDSRIWRRSAADLASLQHQTNTATNSSPQMQHKAALLSSVGLEFKWLLKREPRVLFLHNDKLQSTLQYLKDLGVNVPKVLHSAPGLLEHNPSGVGHMAKVPGHSSEYMSFSFGVQCRAEIA
eukprot:EG_transcript_19369